MCAITSSRPADHRPGVAAPRRAVATAAWPTDRRRGACQVHRPDRRHLGRLSTGCAESGAKRDTANENLLSIDQRTGVDSPRAWCLPRADRAWTAGQIYRLLALTHTLPVALLLFRTAVWWQGGANTRRRGDVMGRPMAPWSRWRRTCGSSGVIRAPRRTSEGVDLKLSPGLDTFRKCFHTVSPKAVSLLPVVAHGEGPPFATPLWCAIPEHGTRRRSRGVSSPACPRYP
jgi:hypothetical protein